MAKERKEGRFLKIPTIIMEQRKFIELSAYAKMLLWEIFYQFRGFNNGDLAATWSMMEKRGFRSRSTLSKAIQELLQSGMIKRTRLGGRNCCALYAVTWLAIDECIHPRTRMSKFDAGIKPGPPPGTWKDSFGNC